MFQWHITNTVRFTVSLQSPRPGDIDVSFRRGMQQADATGKYLKEVEFTNMFASIMARARQVSGDDAT